MNMIVSPALSATPNGTTRPQVRIVIVGHVDHGKSTLVGRLLHETGSLPEGKLEMLKAVSARRGMPFEWSFLLDALQTERDQGITIDTTQIRFRTAAREYLLIDAPGHKQFLKNMVSGAAGADAVILVVDAHEGVQDQTRRHAYLLRLLGIRRIIVAVNKMDLAGYAEARYQEVRRDVAAYLRSIGVNAQDLDSDLVTGFDHLQRVRYAGPAHLGHVQQPLDAAAEIDEGAEFAHRRDPPGQDGSFDD